MRRPEGPGALPAAPSTWRPPSAHRRGRGRHERGLASRRRGWVGRRQPGPHALLLTRLPFPLSEVGGQKPLSPQGSWGASQPLWGQGGSVCRASGLCLRAGDSGPGCGARLSKALSGCTLLSSLLLRSTCREPGDGPCRVPVLLSPEPPPALHPCWTAFQHRKWEFIPFFMEPVPLP